MNTHGWTDATALVVAPDWQKVELGAFVEEHHRCACPRDWCQREATEEDLRCDECREVCA